MTRFDAVDEDDEPDPHDGCPCYGDCRECTRCDCCTCETCPEEQWEERYADG